MGLYDKSVSISDSAGSVLKNAGSGALAGSALGPVGAAIGGGLGLATSLIGGIFGSRSQRKANEANLKIAQMTNESNERIAKEANELQYKMQQEQFDYASPARQRQMLEEAGMNPYLYASQSAHAGTAPSVTTGAGQIAAQMMPEDALSRSISGLTTDLFANYATVQNARKAEAEALHQEVANEFQVSQITQQLRLLGQEEEANRIELRYKDPKERITYNNLMNDFKIGLERIQQLKLVNAFQKYFNNKIAPQQFNELLANIELLKEKKVSEISQQDLNSKLGISNLRSSAAQMITAAVNDYLKESQRQFYEGSAENQRQQAAINEIEASIKRVYGSKTADAILESTNAGAEMTRAKARLIYTQDRKLQQEMRFDEFYGHVKGIGSLLSGLRGR